MTDNSRGPLPSVAEVLPKYGVRSCRGHWHVVVQWIATGTPAEIEDGIEVGEYCCDDLAIEGDPFTEADARAMAEHMNNGFEPRSSADLYMERWLSVATAPRTPVAPQPTLWQRIIHRLRRQRPSVKRGEA